jgi:hypothetical protein
VQPAIAPDVSAAPIFRSAAARQYMCCPPLIEMLAPVMNAASSEAR